MKLQYDFDRQSFQASSLEVIEQANAIIDDYARQGFSLTLRQLYYQFVARALLSNTDRSYKRLGSIVNDGRMAGLIDWYAIEDRTRFLRAISTWDEPSGIIESAAASYATDRWARQPSYCEVWIEKDALTGVIEPACNDLDVPYFSCRGYTSQSEVWRAAQRLIRKIGYDEKQVVVFHLGDHDPSGIDMSRDIYARLRHFIVIDLQRDFGYDFDRASEIVAERFRLERLALNPDQVEEYQPPPNPAKLSDSRARGYIAEYGDESWELDALEPTVIDELIRDAVGGIRDEDLWQEATDEMERERESLTAVSNRWSEVVEFLEPR
jgi:hypothetical protein